MLKGPFFFVFFFFFFFFVEVEVEEVGGNLPLGVDDLLIALVEL